jgi:molecular chaperone GrpE (heat shock protein)
MEEQTNQHVAEIKVEKDQTEQTEQPEESQANAENSAKAKAAFDESVKNAYRSAMGSLLELADDLNREANIFIDASLLEEEIDRVHRVTGFAHRSDL